MLKASSLRCEYLQNPLGIGEKKPCFGYKIESDRQNVYQSAYRLQVADNPDFDTPLWDSGTCASDASVHIQYGGPALQSFTKYYYRVEITDNYGETSPWSETASFETANLGDYAWIARFISPAQDTGESSQGYYLRKAFDVKPGLVSARVYATALGMYELSVNGSPAADYLLTPGWTEYAKRLPYQTYDITGLLSEGSNAVGGLLGCGWFKGDLAGWEGKRNFYGPRNALFAEIHLQYADGSKAVIPTGTDWQCANSPILMSELYHGETYDARLEIPGWDKPGNPQGEWTPPDIIDWDLDTLTAQDGLPVKRQETFEPLSLFTTPAGEQVMDFGQNMSGFVEFKVSGAPGDRVVLKHAEVLDKEGNFYTKNLRSARCTVEYILKGGAEECFAPHFTFQGFRYVMIETYPGTVSTENFKAVVIHSDMERAGSFTCDNALINQLCHNILWGMKGNFVDVPTDCPQRDERLGWTGDAQVFIMAANYLMKTEKFYQKWFRDVALAQSPTGGIPHVVPDILKNGEGSFSSGWGDAAVICPWTTYLTSGDKKMLAEQYPSMKKWVEHIRGCADRGLIWNSGFHFGDWVALDAKEGSCFGATPVDLIATAYYAYSTDLVSRAAEALGLTDEAAAYRQLYADIAKDYQSEFYTPYGRLAARTQTAHILTLMFGLCPDAYKERTINTLIALIRENENHLVTGFLGTPYFCHVLERNGKLDEAYALLMREEYPSWLYQVKAGATTIWEHWDGIKPDGSMWSEGMNSFNHYAYGSIGDWIFGVVGGLKPDESQPGYKRIQIAPKPGGGIHQATTEYDSPYGKIRIAWKEEEDKTEMEVLIPHNTTAVVTLPGAADGTYGGVRFEAQEGGASAEIGSGCYTFSWQKL